MVFSTLPWSASANCSGPRWGVGIRGRSGAAVVVGARAVAEDVPPGLGRKGAKQQAQHIGAVATQPLVLRTLVQDWTLTQLMKHQEKNHRSSGGTAWEEFLSQ